MIATPHSDRESEKVIILNGSRQLGLNMTFLIKSIRLGLQQFSSPKIQEELTETHYIR